MPKVAYAIVLHIPEACPTEEKILVSSIRGWLTGDQEGMIKQYATAVRTFGIQYGLHVYDLLRLVLKMRVDFSTAKRKSVLGLSAEFYRWAR